MVIKNKQNKSRFMTNGWLWMLNGITSLTLRNCGRRARVHDLLQKDKLQNDRLKEFV